MKKASNHRKRHPPPGPCGIWFQTQRQLGTTDGKSIPSQNSANSLPSVRSASQMMEHQHRRHHHLKDMSVSPAWTAMQQSLGLPTPYLPTIHNDTPRRRYDLLRPYFPSNYVLLWQILSGEYDFTIEDPHRLLVLVHSVEAHIQHNIWTVQLQDETGVLLRAWLEPKFVQEQMQVRHRDSSSTIRPGVVWMLRKVGMIVVPNEDDDEKIERMLLVSGAQIERVWTPEGAPEDSSDSPRAQRTFLEWMERRTQLAASFSVDGEEVEELDGPGDDEDIPQVQQQTIAERTNEDDEAELDRFSGGAISASNTRFNHGIQASQSRHPVEHTRNSTVQTQYSQNLHPSGSRYDSTNTDCDTQPQQRFSQSAQSQPNTQSLLGSREFPTNLMNGEWNSRSQHSQLSRTGGSQLMRSTNGSLNTQLELPGPRSSQPPIPSQPLQDSNHGGSLSMRSKGGGLCTQPQEKQESESLHQTFSQHFLQYEHKSGNLSMRSKDTPTQQGRQEKSSNAVLDSSVDRQSLTMSQSSVNQKENTNCNSISGQRQLSSDTTATNTNAIAFNKNHGAKRHQPSTSSNKAEARGSRGLEKRRKQTKRAKHTLSPVAKASAIWMTNDTAVLGLLDEEEEDTVQEETLNSNGNDEPTLEAASLPKTQSPQTDGDGEPGGGTTVLTQTRNCSIFDATNLEGIDVSGFSEEEE